MSVYIVCAWTDSGNCCHVVLEVVCVLLSVCMNSIVGVLLCVVFVYVN